MAPAHHWALRSSNLKDGDDGPEQGVKILPVWQCVPIPLGRKLAAKQMHTQDAEDTGSQGQGQVRARPAPPHLPDQHLGPLPPT